MHGTYKASIRGVALGNELHDRVSAILRLLARRRPSTIIRLIIAVVINALNGVLRSGFTTHISQESFEILPSVTDSNPAGAVQIKMARIFIRTALFHRLPRAIFRSHFAWISRCEAVDTHSLDLKTTARAMLASREITTESNAGLAAITMTIPSNLYAFIFGTRHNNQPMKTSASEIRKSPHIGMILSLNGGAYGR